MHDGLCSRCAAALCRRRRAVSNSLFAARVALLWCCSLLTLRCSGRAVPINLFAASVALWARWSLLAFLSWGSLFAAHVALLARCSFLALFCWRRRSEQPVRLRRIASRVALLLTCCSLFALPHGGRVVCHSCCAAAGALFDAIFVLLWSKRPAGRALGGYAVLALRYCWRPVRC